MTTKELLELEDFAHFAETAELARHVFASAHTGATCLAEQIEPLCSQTALPENLRVAYAELKDTLLKLAQLAKQGEQRYRYLAAWERAHPDVSGLYSNEAVVGQALRAIGWFNAVEKQLSQTMQELTRSLRDAKHTLRSWEDPSVELNLMIEVEPSAERQCYQELIEPAYFKLRPSFEQFVTQAENTHLLGHADNWNEYRDSDHPLHGAHLGYLAYSVLNGTHLPWQLFGRARTIEVDIEIRASRTLRAEQDPDIAAT